MREENTKTLLGHVKKNDLVYTTRCDRATEHAIRILATKKHLKTLAIQEEGGWFTYKRYAKPNNLKLNMLKMREGKIQNIPKNAIIVLHSTPAYAYVEDMKNVLKQARKKNSLVINDCCGAIGKHTASIGDVITCSFGKHKPLSSGGGGFLAFNKEFNYIKKDEKLQNNTAKTKINHENLNKALKQLPKKYEKWKKINQDLIKELPTKNILNNKNNANINILITYKNQTEKERLIKHLKSKNIQYVQCPKYIRTNKKALSIEIKRL